MYNIYYKNVKMLLLKTLNEKILYRPSILIIIINTNTLKTCEHYTILKPNRKSHDFRKLFVKTFS